MKNIIEHSERRDIGSVRKNNEDDFICKAFDNYPNLLLLGAIDGVGGYEGGEVATEITKKTLENYFFEHIEEVIKQPEGHMKKAVVLANNKIYNERKESIEYNRMSCVVTVALLDKENQRLYFAHVGDTRGYVLRNKELVKFTKDHSLVGYLEETKEITEAEAMSHPRRNEISKLLGGSELKEDTDYILSGVHSFYPDDIILFCSDGLTDLVNSNSIIESLIQNQSLEFKRDELIDKANALGGKDNITVALATYKGDLNQTATIINQPDEFKKKVDSKEKPSETFTDDNRENSKGKKTKRLLFLIFSFLIIGIGLYIFKQELFFINKEDKIEVLYNNQAIEDKIDLPLKINVPELPIIYDYEGKLSEGLKLVRLNDKFGFIDDKDSLVIGLKYDYAEGFKNGLAKVKIVDKYGLIDPKDSIIVKIEYNEISEIVEGKLTAKKDSIWKTINVDEKYIKSE